MEQLFKTLKKFKNIEPGAEYKKRSLMLIYNAPQNQRDKELKIFQPFFYSFQMGTALALATVLIVLVSGGFAVLGRKISSVTLTNNVNTKNLTDEANSLNIQIQLSQLKYYEDSLQKIDVALNQTSNHADEKEPTISPAQNETLN